MWLRALKYRLTSGDPEGARRTLDRSLQSLPAFEHVRMISQAALLEFKQGDAGEGASQPVVPLAWAARQHASVAAAAGAHRCGAHHPTCPRLARRARALAV